jgi:hypothetical protein
MRFLSLAATHNPLPSSAGNGRSDPWADIYKGDPTEKIVQQRKAVAMSTIAERMLADSGVIRTTLPPGAGPPGAFGPLPPPPRRPATEEHKSAKKEPKPTSPTPKPAKARKNSPAPGVKKARTRSSTVVSGKDGSKPLS